MDNKEVNRRKADRIASALDKWRQSMNPPVTPMSAEELRERLK